MIFKEWIKKDEVMDIIKGLPQDLWEEYIYMLKGVWCDEDMHIEALKAEPIVRCKDCTHRYRHDSGNYFCEMYYGMGDVSDENFCSFGERKD